MRNYLEFESEIKGLEEQLDKLKDPFNKEVWQKLIQKKLIKFKVS
jgi:hypothetical protein